MLIFEKVSEFQEHLLSQRKLGKSVGFVPTMGALHNGHLSLITACSNENDICVCSIFVNPIQFNDKNDLLNYPRDKDGDVSLLESSKCTVLFYPDVSEIYPNQLPKTIDLGGIETLLEGRHRPGHFNGVSTVIQRFFEIIEPDKAYFGLKDYQQFLIVKKLSQKLGGSVEVIGCETARDKMGLALSSRNRLLSEIGREKALLLHQNLMKAKKLISTDLIPSIKKEVEKDFEESAIDLEYFEIVDADTLKRVSNASQHDSIIACIAAYVEGVRLIDNLILIP